jgi:hypothetical protein
MAREAERRRARVAAGKPIHLTPEELKAQDKAEDERLEREIQAECVREYRANGFTLWEGLKDKKKVKIQPGHPDLELFHPRYQWHGYHEVKTPRGELEPAQRDFMEMCDACNVPFFVGGINVVALVIATARGDIR